MNQDLRSLKHRSARPRLSVKLQTVIVSLVLAFAESAQSTDTEVVASIMRSQYGSGFNSKHQCWTHKSTGWGLYCMKPINIHRIDAHGVPRLYVLAEGVPMNLAGELEEAGAHAAPGVVGAFLVSLYGTGKFTVLAATKELHFGSFGAASAGDAKFLKVGASDYYGWTFFSGGMWMGTIVTWHHIVAPRGTQFVDLSAIPETSEDDQDHTYEIAFDTTQLDRKFFPLLVTKRFTGEGKRFGPATVTFRVAFNTETGRYQLRKGE